VGGWGWGGEFGQARAQLGGSVERARTGADRPAGVRTMGRGRWSSSERRGGSSAIDSEQGREESLREREIGEGARAGFIEREREGEPGRNDRPSTPSMAAAINSALSERSGGGRGGATTVSDSGRRAGAAPRGRPGRTARRHGKERRSRGWAPLIRERGAGGGRDWAPNGPVWPTRVRVFLFFLFFSISKYK
jgi:hypothetical protein